MNNSSSKNVSVAQNALYLNWTHWCKTNLIHINSSLLKKKFRQSHYLVNLCFSRWWIMYTSFFRWNLWLSFYNRSWGWAFIILCKVILPNNLLWVDHMNHLSLYFFCSFIICRYFYSIFYTSTDSFTAIHAVSKLYVNYIFFLLRLYKEPYF
jgi:hypothetical protein